MSGLPRVRWMVLLVAMAYAVTLAGNGYDWQAALGGLGLKAAGLPALLLSVGRVLGALMDKIDEEDPYVHTMTRESRQPEQSFLGRVW